MAVIYVVQDADLQECHFATSHYSMIVWQAPEDLRDRLCQRIVATIGFPPEEE